MSETTNALAVIEKLPIDHPIRSHLAYASVFVQSGMWPDVKTASAAIVKIQAGAELGLKPFFSMKNIRIIQGSIELSGHGMATLVKLSGKYDYRVREKTEKLCTIQFFQQKRDNGQMEPIGEETFTIEMANRAGLTKNPAWRNFPEAMLFNRAMSAGMRTHTPDVGLVYAMGEIGGDPDREMEGIQIEHLPPAPPDPPPIPSSWPTGVPEVSRKPKPKKKRMTVPKTPLADPAAEVQQELSTASPQDVQDDQEPDLATLTTEQLEAMIPDDVPSVLRKALLDYTEWLRSGDDGYEFLTPQDAWRSLQEMARRERKQVNAAYIRNLIT